MKHLLSILLLLSVLGACRMPLVKGTTSDLWVSGDPLASGWKMCGPGEFVVENGVLKTTGGMGMLWYAEEDFKNFELELEWMAEDPSFNSGVFVRFPDPGQEPYVAVNEGYEIQICDLASPKHNTGSVYSFQAATSIPTLWPGAWNRMRIQVWDQRYKIYVNDELVNEYTGDRSSRGYVGLQNHDDHSPVRFRNIRVTR